MSEGKFCRVGVHRYSGACQPMILPVKLVTTVLCILAKFRDFFETGNSDIKYIIYM